jgi:hypothetical protein
MPHVTPLHADDPRRVGRYRLAGRISGMPASGPVYLARSVDGDDVTVTILGGDWTGDGAARDRFADEAAAARRVPPFCTARIVGSGADGGDAFLVSEYVAGPSLLELVSTAGPLGEADLEALATGGVTGLAAIHQAGLVHGSFGPEYLILGPQGPRVAGFGITPPYGAATPAADMLAWAQTIAYAATGAPMTAAALATLPQRLRAVVTECLEPSPAARPTARSAVAELIGDASPAAGLLAEAARRAALLVLPAAPAAHSRAQAKGQPQRRPPRRRTAGTQAAIIGAVVGLLVIVVIAVHIVQNAGTQPGAAAASPSLGTTHAPRHRSRVPAASAGDQQSVSARPFPQSLAGDWTGQVRQDNPADNFTVKIHLAAGAHSGTISYSGASFSCSGRLILVRAAKGFTLDQEIVHGQSTCANGVVTLESDSGNGLAFSFRGKAGPAARGTLARQ